MICLELGKQHAACNAADRVNMTPVEHSLRLMCNHVGSERQEMLHVCQGCFTNVICGDMRVHPDPAVDLCVCPVCFADSVDNNVDTFLAYPVGAHQVIAQDKGRGYRTRLIQKLPDRFEGPRDCGAPSRMSRQRSGAPTVIGKMAIQAMSITLVPASFYR